MENLITNLSLCILSVSMTKHLVIFVLKGGGERGFFLGLSMRHFAFEPLIFYFILNK